MLSISHHHILIYDRQLECILRLFLRDQIFAHSQVQQLPLRVARKTVSKEERQASDSGSHVNLVLYVERDSDQSQRLRERIDEKIVVLCM